MRFAIIATLSFAVAAPASADQIWLTMDQVRPYKIARAAGQIVVGNPAIADVTILDKDRLLMFGKAPGLTNLFVYDENGEEIDNIIVRVQTNNVGTLTLQRGAQRVSLSCTTNCVPTITVGDSAVAFSETAQQVDQKFQQAKNSNSGAGAQ
jgi:Flp pilus assembly secretin CpaC